MANYGQYNRNHQSMKPQVTSEEAADALEQSIFDSDHLWEKYRDDISPLLQQAELRLGHELKEKKFNNMENIIKTHVDRWYRLTKNLSAMTLNFRTQGNHIIVKLDSLKNEIEERDKIIRTQRKDYENEKDQYENQLKVLESALADSIPRNKTLSKYEPQLAKVETNQQIQQLTKDLAAQEQQYQKLKIENQRLSQNLKLLNSGANDFQQTLTNLNNEIAKKEDEILSLRWLTQDLAAERNGLEQKIQTGAKDPNFTSVTPQRQMNYDIDLSAFLDGDEDVSDDAVENGMMFLEMNDDADINPEVAKKLAEALEAVRKVTQFANDRDYEAKQLEDKTDDHRPDRPQNRRNHPSSKPSPDELYTNFEDMKKLQDSSPSKAHTLISQMGQFNGLINHMEAEESSYTAMLKRIESQMENGTKCINVITRCVSTVMEDEHNRQSNNKRAQKLHQLQTHSQSLISILNEIMTELRGAADYIHPDHKKVEIMENKIKELELTIPYIESEQLAILNTLPSFLKQELNKRHRSNRIRNKQQDAQLDQEEEKQRQMNFDNALGRVELLSIQIKEKTDTIKNNLRSNLEKSQTDPKAFALYLQQIDIACDQISEYVLSLDDEFHFTREYIHPSQAALIAVVNQYNNLQIDCEQMQTILSIKQGEIHALEEIKDTKPKRVIASSAGPPPGFEDKGPKPHSLVSRDESFQFDDIEKDFMKFAEEQQTKTNAMQTIATNEASGTAEVDADHIVPLMANILGIIKDRSNTIRSNLKVLNQSGYADKQYTNLSQLNYDLNHALNDMNECIDDMNTKLIRVKQIMGPDSKYISRLEKRYVQIMGLYQMKYAEVEHKEDLLYQSDQYINNLKDDIADLDYRLGAVMSSAVSNVETRMTAFNEMGIKIQTIQKVMKLMDDTYTNIQQACQDIQESVEKDLYDIIGDVFDDQQHQETAGMLGNVAHACDYILKAFSDIEQEMDGVAQFVHPDREMCEKLQTELIAFYEQQEAEQQQQEQMEMKDEHEDVLSNLPPQQQKQQQRHNPDVRPGDSHDDIVLGRRKSLLAFHQAFDNEAKRRSQTYDNKLQKEDRRRSRHSSNRRRRSSVSNVVGLLLPLPDMGDPQSKSDIGGHKLEPEELDDDDDKLFVNSLRRDVRAATTARPDSAAPSPAPSPRNSPTQNANSPMGSAADEFELNIADAVDDELLNVNVIPPPRDQVQLNRQKDKDIELLKTQIDGKAQLVRDLKQNVQELTENRRRELMHFQGSLETMKSRCREWYEQLMARVREMELTYQDRVNEEVERRAVELHRELADERRRMRDEFEKQLAAQQQTTADLSSNPHEIDELSREIARLNEELEKFKGKYFDSEQQKIELADALDELKEEKFKMEEKLEVSCTTSVDSAIAFYEPHKDNIKSNEYELSPTYSTRFAIRDKPQTAHVLATVEAVLLHMRNHVLVPQFIFDTVLCFYAVPINIRYKTHINQFLCCPITDSWHSIALNRVVCIAFGIRMCVSATLRFSNGGERVKEWKPDTWKETDIYDVTEEHLEYELEIERLNEQLEKFKNKYFDAEQQKIEFEDQLDEIKEEKFIMEERIELGDQLVQKLRIEKENLITQHEEELRAFERMANEKVAQLEEYYVQQLQINHVHVQQLQQQLQQQPINQDNMNQLNSKMKLCSIIHKNVAIMMRI
eukprot:532350_1